MPGTGLSPRWLPQQGAGWTQPGSGGLAPEQRGAEPPARRLPQAASVNRSGGSVGPLATPTRPDPGRRWVGCRRSRTPARFLTPSRKAISPRPPGRGNVSTSATSRPRGPSANRPRGVLTLAPRPALSGGLARRSAAGHPATGSEQGRCVPPVVSVGLPTPSFFAKLHPRDRRSRERFKPVPRTAPVPGAF